MLTVGGKDINISRIRRARETSYDKLGEFRNIRYKIIKQMVGRNYSSDGSDDRVPLNLMEMAIGIYVRNLVAQSPSTIVTSRVSEYQPFAADMQADVNHSLVQMRLVDTVREVVTNALVGMGIGYLGLEEVNDRRNVGGVQVGRPFCVPIDLDDWVHDMKPGRWPQVQFMGHRHTMTLKEAKRNPLFDEKAAAKLQPTDRWASGKAGESPVSELSGHDDPSLESYEDTVELWDLWIPGDRVILTIPADDSDLVLRILDWDGPEHGPYHRLTFTDIPSNTIPLSLGASLLDLHLLLNDTFVKVARQATRQKTVVGAQASAGQDADRIINAKDGEMIRLDHPEAIKEFRFGGPDQQGLAFSMMVKDAAAYYGGNLDMLGGLSPSAATVGQDQLLASNATKKLSEMQDRTTEFVRNIIRDIAWYNWTDPLRTRMVTRYIEGVPLPIHGVVGPDTRKGDWMDYDFDIQPYSMVHRTPQMRLQTLMQTLNQIVVPMAAQMQQQGSSIDVRKLLDIVANYSDMQELREIIVDAKTGTPTLGSENSGPGPTKPATTTRRYERVNSPVRSQPSADFALTQALLGKGVQPAESGGVNR